MGKTIEHFGPAGSGQATKATNQIMCAGIIRACAEAMAFAGAHGLPLDRVVSTLGAGAGSSWYFVHRAPNMVRGSYPAGFRIKLHAKDLGICRDMAARFGVSLPVVDSMLAEYATLMAQGYGDEDISATHRLKQALFEDRRETQRHEPRPPGAAAHAEEPRQLYLPNFCAASTVLVIVVICELTALLLALARNSAALGFWSDLGLTSMFLLWIALCGAGLLCVLRNYLSRQSVAVSAALVLAHHRRAGHAGVGRRLLLRQQRRCSPMITGPSWCATPASPSW